jgi:hypothetical protein
MVIIRKNFIHDSAFLHPFKARSTFMSKLTSPMNKVKMLSRPLEEPMNRRPLNLLLPALLSGILLAGCQKSADQPATSGTPGSSTDATQSAQTQAPPAPVVPPAPQPVVVPARTAIPVVLDQSISSKTAAAGQSFSATLQAPIAVDGVVVIPKGAHATGEVTDAKSAGRFKGGATLGITLTSVNVRGTEYKIDTTDHDSVSKGKGKRTAAMVGGGGAGGLLIGGLAGGGKGALIGGLIGAGAGTTGSAFSGNRDITLPAETPVTFRLQQSITITPAP